MLRNIVVVGSLALGLVSTVDGSETEYCEEWVAGKGFNYGMSLNRVEIDPVPVNLSPYACMKACLKLKADTNDDTINGVLVTNSLELGYGSGVPDQQCYCQQGMEDVDDEETNWSTCWLREKPEETAPEKTFKCDWSAGLGRTTPSYNYARADVVGAFSSETCLEACTKLKNDGDFTVDGVQVSTPSSGNENCYCKQGWTSVNAHSAYVDDWRTCKLIEETPAPVPQPTPTPVAPPADKCANLYKKTCKKRAGCDWKNKTCVAAIPCEMPEGVAAYPDERLYVKNNKQPKKGKNVKGSDATDLVCQCSHQCIANNAPYWTLAISKKGKMAGNKGKCSCMDGKIKKVKRASGSKSSYHMGGVDAANHQKITDYRTKKNM